MNPMLEVISEIIHDSIKAGGVIYDQEGLFYAFVYVTVSPILIPFAAISYYSMSEETRELLTESEEFVDT